MSASSSRPATGAHGRTRYGTHASSRPVASTDATHRLDQTPRMPPDMSTTIAYRFLDGQEPCATRARGRCGSCLRVVDHDDDENGFSRLTAYSISPAGRPRPPERPQISDPPAGRDLARNGLDQAQLAGPGTGLEP